MSQMLEQMLSDRSLVQRDLMDLQEREIRSFYEINAPLISQISQNIQASLESRRFVIDKERTTAELTFLFVQAKIAQDHAFENDDNSLSGFNVGSAIGVHLPNPEIPAGDFYSESGANREPHPFEMSTHAETSGIEVIRRQLAARLVKDHDKLKIDLVVNTHGAAPCGACRGEIFKHRDQDNTLVCVVSDDGQVTINTIAELFPTKFSEVEVSEIPRIGLNAAKMAANLSVQSQYLSEDKLPPWGVSLVSDNEQVFRGFHMGEAGFWSQAPVLDAISYLVRHAINLKIGVIVKEPDQILKVRKEACQRVKQVIFYYDGNFPDVFPSGIERQQLSELPQETIIYLVSPDKAYKTTRGELLPNAFVAPS